MSKDTPSDGVSNAERSGALLLKMARYDIYRINAFRVLAISVTATPREISSRMQKYEMMEQMGNMMPREKGFLPLIPLPDGDTRREAHQRLNDPESRLIDELFWFWPLWFGLPEVQDDALTAFKNNDFEGAISIWKQHEQQASEANVSTHNLAIVYHTLALDIEHMGLSQTLSEKQLQHKREYWDLAFPRWQILLNHDGFWQRLTKRIRELDDPRLTTGTARRIRIGLPVVILSINAKLAVQSAQKGHHNEAMYHLKLMNNSGFEKASIDKALLQAVSPVRERIKLICENINGENKNTAENAEEFVNKLVAETTHLLSTLDILLAQTHATRESAHDEVAKPIHISGRIVAIKTGNWYLSRKILEQAMQIAASGALRKSIQDDLAAVKTHL